MPLSYLEGIILYCFQQLKCERSKAAVFHLLKGKKSSQTIQDSIIFHLSNLFGICRELELEEYNHLLNRLVQLSYVKQVKGEFYMVTMNGERVLQEFLSEKPFPDKLDGATYNDIGKIFWQRLSLFVQTVSHLVYNHSKFLPITNNGQLLHFVKTYILQMKETKKNIGNRTFLEMNRLLECLDEKGAILVVNRLSGFKKNGITFEQLAAAANEDPFYLKLMFQAAVIQMVNELQKRSDQYPILFGLLRDLIKKHPLTASAEKTYRLLAEGLGIDEIAAFRKLKRNTIEDHIVEIALNMHDFAFEPYVSKEDVVKIGQAIEKLQTNKLKTVKEYLQDQYSYFQIRLAMAAIRRWQ
ncbi:helix-turn-helix domain-containing protein [Aeribacillus sp. FSL K6-8394]|uniref:helix-turn-helix domain-containing protein n=1 Tax=Aeribacillus sp. FSL K6-8394 TaxID=2954570 RepID=UPI0030F970A6